MTSFKLYFKGLFKLTLELSGSIYLRSFKNAVQHDLNCQFSKSKLLDAVQETVPLKFIERKGTFQVLLTCCCKSLIFQVVVLINSKLHSERVDYPIFIGDMYSHFVD